MDFINKLEQALEVSITRIEKEYSMRNQVYLTEVITEHNLRKKFIIKKYIGSATGNEVFILHMLKQYGLRVPQLTWYDDNIIVMEYIHGFLLADLLVDQKCDQKLWIYELARWLNELHGLMDISKQTCLCLADLNLRNFIFDGQVFYGIDFENVCFYPRERDLGVICAFILNNDPMFEKWKYSICSSLISCYDQIGNNGHATKLNPDLIWYYLIEELKAAAERRKHQRDLLMTKIKELKYSSIFNSR